MHKWVQIQISIMHVTDILHQWLSIPEYLHKSSKSMYIEVIVIEKFLLPDSEGFRLNNFVLLRTLLSEICTEKRRQTMNYLLFVIF